MASQIVLEGNVVDVLKDIEDGFFDCVITSPPYWGLRDYGLEPIIWDAKNGCEHNFNEYNSKLLHENRQNLDGGTIGNADFREKLHGFGNAKAGFCSLCGAWRGSLGLEPTFNLYLDHLMQIMAECKRVLKKTGTMWVNIGDSYAGSGKGIGTDRTKCKESYTDDDIAKSDWSKCSIPAKSLIGIPERFAIRMTDELGMIRRNTIIWYKRNCLCGSTTLYAKTQKGVMPSTIKDLVRLKPETVKLWDGIEWQQVKEWIKNSNPIDIKKITFRNGESITCTGEHKFPLINGIIKTANNLQEGDIIKSTNLPNKNKNVEYIPDNIGWLIGTYLSDGSLGDKGNCIQISSHKREKTRFNKLKSIAEQYDANCYKFDKEGNSVTFNIYSKILIAIIKTYISGNNAKNKHLTNAVWERNNNFLYEVLIGYLEGDGYYEEKNNRYRLGFTRNDYLACDLRVVCSRLGYEIKLQKTQTILKDNIFKTYKGEIRLNKQNHHNNKSSYEIISIIKGKNAGYFWDIVLEEEPHLFASHSGLLIHNCMPSSASDRFTVDFEYVYFFTKQGDYWFEQQKEPYTAPLDRWGGDKLKANGKSTWDEGTGQTTYRDRNMRPNSQGRNMRTVWNIPTKPLKGAHFATFPIALVEPMLKAGCPEFVCKKCGKAREKIYEKTGNLIGMGGYGSKTAEHIGVSPTSSLLTKKVQEQIEIGLTDCGCNAGFDGGWVLDPFAGSGTVGVVAKQQNKNFIGVELNPDYCAMGEARIEKS